MIVILRGTSGSGKTYIVNRLMDALGAYDETLKFGPRAVHGGYVWHPHALTILGRYETACGGCDSYSWPGAADHIEELARGQTERGHNVLFEGLMISSWGTERLRRLGPALIVIHIGTPLEECLAGVQARRDARAAATGRALGPLNPSNTIKKHAALLTSTRKHRREGLRVEMLTRPEALARTTELLGLTT
jgi:hypothetical protein